MKSETNATSRHLIAWYDTYAEAERAVDSLADEGFPVSGLSILAEDLRFTENVTGHKGFGRAGFETAVAGGLAGSVLGFLFGLLSWVDPLISGLALALYGFLLGAVIGLVLGLVTHALSGGRRNFSSVGSLTADRYEVVADDPETAKRARLMLKDRHPVRA